MPSSSSFFTRLASEIARRRLREMLLRHDLAPLHRLVLGDVGQEAAGLSSSSLLGVLAPVVIELRGSR
jgi:hypothetical protein